MTKFKYNLWLHRVKMEDYEHQPDHYFIWNSCCLKSLYIDSKHIMHNYY